MRLTVFVGATLLALNVGLLAGQAAPQGDLSKLTPTPEPVTIRFQNAQFADVMQFLGKASGIQIGLALDVTVPKEPLNINIDSAKFADVFTFLVTAANRSYTVINEKTVLLTKKS